MFLLSGELASAVGNLVDMAKDPKRPGPIYDRVMRRLAEPNVQRLCDWVGVPVEGTAEVLPSSFAAETLTADLLVRVGPERMLHAEYMRSPDADVAVRMLGYRFHILRRHPGTRLIQVAIVLGEGELKLVDDPQNGFLQGVHTIYLRDENPETLLAVPDLAPMAVLTRGTQEARGARLSATLRLIGQQPEERRAGLIEAALTLAIITLDRSTIERIRKEWNMTLDDVADFYSEVDFGRELQERGRRRGVREGHEQEFARFAVALLRGRFGERPGLPELAGRLARSGAEEAVVIEAIGAAADPDDVERILGC